MIRLKIYSNVLILIVIFIFEINLIGTFAAHSSKHVTTDNIKNYNKNNNRNINNFNHHNNNFNHHNNNLNHHNNNLNHHNNNLNNHNNNNINININNKNKSNINNNHINHNNNNINKNNNLIYNSKNIIKNNIKSNKNNFNNNNNNFNNNNNSYINNNSLNNNKSSIYFKENENGYLIEKSFDNYNDDNLNEDIDDDYYDDEDEDELYNDEDDDDDDDDEEDKNEDLQGFENDEKLKHDSGVILNNELKRVQSNHLHNRNQPTGNHIHEKSKLRLENYFVDSKSIFGPSRENKRPFLSKVTHLKVSGSRGNHLHREVASRLDGANDDKYDNNFVSHQPIIGNYLTRKPREYNVHRDFDEDNRYGHGNSLTEEKFKTLGTPEAVQRASEDFLSTQAIEMAAKRHRLMMETEGKCHQPMKRVVKISKEASRVYVPCCTILHRCGDDTGCCRYPSEVCTNKTAEAVSIYVHVSTINAADGRYFIRNITMYNHTECHCVNRFQTRDKRSHYKLNAARCSCPSYFTPMYPDGYPNSCFCGCQKNDKACNRLQNGLEGFSLKEQKCIRNSECKTPTCNYGEYSLQNGRCPHNIHYEDVG